MTFCETNTYGIRCRGTLEAIHIIVTSPILTSANILLGTNNCFPLPMRWEWFGTILSRCLMRIPTELHVYLDDGTQWERRTGDYAIHYEVLPTRFQETFLSIHTGEKK